MSEGESPKSLEQEIAQIEQDLASKRAVLEQQQKSGEILEIPHEKETLREVIGEKINSQENLGQSSLPTPTIPRPAPSVVAPSYLSEELKTKVQELVNIAFTKTLNDAVKEAKATNNAALIDAFHDALVDELYNYLIERGKLKKM